MNGNAAEADKFLKSLPEGKKREMNRQNSRARGSRARKKAYKLGERPQRRR
jgi:hypothetical protein